MSEMIKHDPVHAPAVFPSNGRWLVDPKEVFENYDRQLAEYRVWRGKMAALGGAQGIDTCADSLHISLFFDGTGNNEHYDTKIAQPPHPTNMARLYHASLEAADDGYFSYYMPGVGTPFPEIGELDFTFLGLAVGNGGGEPYQLGFTAHSRCIVVYAEQETKVGSDSRPRPSQGHGNYLAFHSLG